MIILLLLALLATSCTSVLVPIVDENEDAKNSSVTMKVKIENQSKENELWIYSLKINHPRKEKRDTSIVIIDKYDDKPVVIKNDDCVEYEFKFNNCILANAWNGKTIPDPFECAYAVMKCRIGTKDTIIDNPLIDKTITIFIPVKINAIYPDDPVMIVLSDKSYWKYFVGYDIHSLNELI